MDHDTSFKVSEPSAMIHKSASDSRKYNLNKGKLFSERQKWIKAAIVICCVMDVDIYPTSESDRPDQKQYFT